MTVFIDAHREGFPVGLTELTRIGESEDDTGIGLSVHRLRAGATHEETTSKETAWLLMNGRAEVPVGETSQLFVRTALLGDVAVRGSGGLLRALQDRPLRTLLLSTSDNGDEAEHSQLQGAS